MKKVILFGMLMIIMMSCFSQTNNPPIDKNLFIEFKNTKVILGYSGFEEVQKKLGSPEKLENSFVSVEGFDWGKIKTLYYFNNRLILIFSETNNKLIQICFLPTENDKFKSSFNINNETTKTVFLQFVSKEKYEILQPGNSQVVWITYFSQSVPMLDVNCGIKFNESGRISLIKYFFSAPWK